MPRFSDSKRFGRREFLGAGALALTGMWIGCRDDLVVAPHAHPALAKGGNTGTGTRNVLRIPGTATPTNFTLSAASGTADLGGGSSSAALLFNGQFPGPTLVASRGNRVTMRFVNNLAQPSIVHPHGMIVDHHNDGGPHLAVGTGGYHDYDFVIDQRAALNWYHPHPHTLTGHQVFYGLAGAFIVRDAEEAALNLPSGEFEVPLIIRDAAFDSRGNLALGGKSSGFWGTEPLVNATRRPYLNVKKAVYRFRVLNGCNARVWRLAFASGQAFTLIGNDGGLLATAGSLNQITVSPGERIDIIVDFRTLEAGQTAMLRCVSAGWDLLEFRGTGVAGGGTVPTGTLSTITPLNGPSQVTRLFSFDGMTKINGKVYDMDRLDFEVPVNTTERWRFRTNGNAPHPVHVHGAHFQVVSRTGGRGQVFPWERGWKDTVLLEDKETVDVLIRFSIPSMYVIHCHQLAHEDQGMMQNFRVK